ncbi:MAG: DNA polymerase III subunit alpha [Mariprofundales bacterium]|nr:DNA polymerase III subunit alpha [Mariprofundales bacterium]
MQFSHFAHLHTHSDYSLLNSAMTVDQMIARAVTLRQPALALTDYGNLFGAIEFYTKAMRKGIKPILGCELYIVDDMHQHEHAPGGRPNYAKLVVLARNNIGWHNLLHLVSDGYLEGFYYKPRIDRARLAEHSRGLIALSSGDGEIDRALRDGDAANARNLCQSYRDIFPNNSFFIELQADFREGTVAMNQRRIELARELDLPLVASNNAHFLHAEDFDAYRAMVAIGRNRLLSDIGSEEVSAQNYFKSEAEMRELFEATPEAIENTLHIANRCNVDLQFGNYQLPDFALPDGIEIDAYFRQQATKGLDGRWPTILFGRPDAQREEYDQRLEFELGVIKKMGFPGYFLIVADFIQWSKQQEIPVGPGRGSGAGSLVAYAMLITDLDPIRYGLLFERFLNPERVSMPDFDIDFCMERRGEAIQYVTEHYGQERVSQIITFGSMKAKAVVRDVGRVLAIDLGKINTIAKLIPSDLKMTLEKALIEEPKLEAMRREDPEVTALFDLATKLEGMHRNAGTHAAGVVIGRTPLVEVAPLFKLSGEEGKVVQWDMAHAEKMGLIKFDFLGLKTLTVIDKACRNVRREPKLADFDIVTIPMDDQKTFALLQQGQTSAVFQVESDGMRDLLRKVLPDCFEDIIALVALYRPGPLESGMVEDFIERKHGRQESVYALPQLKPILEETYGVILYQEQVMKIAQVLAGYSLGQADMLRRAMGKKKPEEMDKQRTIFMEGCTKNRIAADKAEYIFDLMAKFAGYGFNKSHSAAYALIAYQTAYLKAHFPQAFMAATLSCDMGNSDKIAALVSDCQRMEITILPPDMNTSEWAFVPEKRSIRFGLGAIKGVGEAASLDLVAQRNQGGAFTSLEDIVTRCGDKQINKRLMESLIKAGATNGVLPHMHAAIEGIDHALSGLKSRKKRQTHRQGSLFSATQMPATPLFPQLPEWSAGECLQQEREVLGFYLSGHPLQDYLANIDQLGSGNLVDILRMEDQSPVVVAVGVSSIREHRGGKGTMAFVQVEDLHGSAESVFFAKNYTQYRELLAQEKPLLLVGYLDKSREKPSILVHELHLLAEALPKLISRVRLRSSAIFWDAAAIESIQQAARDHPGETTLVLDVRLPDGSIAELNSGVRLCWNTTVHQQFQRQFGKGMRCERREWKVPPAKRRFIKKPPQSNTE